MARKLALILNVCLYIIVNKLFLLILAIVLLLIPLEFDNILNL